MTGCSSNTPPPPIQVGLSSTAASVQAGIGTQSFTATVQNDSQNKGVTWALSGAGCTGAACGSLSATSSASGTPITYTAPSSQPNPTGVTLTATSAADTTKSKVATITVTAPVAVTVAPTPVNVQFNAIQFFTATVQNDTANKGVQWTLTQSGSSCSPGCGMLSTNASASGAPIKYTGPSGVPANPSVTLTATSVTDTARTAPAAITITPNPGTTAVTISPARAAIAKWQTQTFVATVTGANDMTVSWQVDGTPGGNAASLGTIDATGKYTPPTTGAIGGSHTITAVSNADVTKNATAPIGVTDLAGVTTYHNNPSRDGVNTHEFALTTSSVKTATFGKLFSCPVDGEVYAQPLWMPNVPIGGGTHNVIFVATQNDSVYAFDADASPCHQYWKTSFLSAGVTAVPSADTGTDDINKLIGITGTPVIDPVSKTLYAVVKTKEPSASYHQRLHAISLADGSDKVPALDITPAITVPGSGDTGDSSVGCTSTSGNVPFCPLREGQRPGLALANGTVYVAWASHGDIQPYHGWMMGFTAATLAMVSTFNDSPNGRESGIWMSGGAPAFDSNNNLYVITGNGDYDGAKDFGDSILKLSSSLVLQDWFTPFVQGTLDASDLDLGAGGAVVLVDLPTSAFPHILIGGGKGTNQLGQVYVVNRDSMGQNASPDKVVQAFDLGGMIYSTAAFWQNTMYIGGVSQQLKAFALNPATSKFTTVASSQSSISFGFPGVTPSVSSSSVTNGIVWALDTHSNGTPAGSANAPAILYAYDATNLATELYHSDSTTGASNAAGSAVKFCVPTVANGRVYVGTQTELTVFGLLP